MARIEAYLYSPGSAETNLNSTNQIYIDEGGGSNATIRLSGPMLFSAALQYWYEAANVALAGGVYLFSYDSTTKRVTLKTTNATTFAITFTGSVNTALGFRDSSYSGSTSYVGEVAPLAIYELLGIEGEIPDANVRSDLVEYRHGRTTSSTFSNHLIADLTLWTDDANLLSSFCSTGKVRVTFDSTDAFASAVPLGYLDGFVYSTPRIESIGPDEGYLAIDMALAIGT